MRLGTTLKLGGLIVALAAVTFPAHAVDDYRLRYDQVRGAAIDGVFKDTFLPGNGKVTIGVEQLEGGGAQGALRVLPAPTSQDASPQDPAQTIGCVTIKLGAFKDSGCTVRDGATVDIDPLLNEAKIVFSVDSKNEEGRQISVVLFLAGQGDIGPAGDVITQHVEPTPPAKPNDVVVDISGVLARSVSIVGGSVRSEAIGIGGPITGVTAAKIFNGLVVNYTANSTCVVTLGSTIPCAP